MCQSSRSVWTMLYGTWWVFWGCPVCPFQRRIFYDFMINFEERTARKGNTTGWEVLLDSGTLQFKEPPLLQETTWRQIDLTLSPVSFHILSHPTIFKILCKKLRLQAALTIITGKDKHRKKYVFDPFMFSCTEHLVCSMHLHSIQRKITWNRERRKYENGSERPLRGFTLVKLLRGHQW